jgi:hypothetical protein
MREMIPPAESYTLSGSASEVFCVSWVNSVSRTFAPNSLFP